MFAMMEKMYGEFIKKFDSIDNKLSKLEDRFDSLKKELMV